MASFPALIALAIVAVAVTPALGTEFIVGDEKGWTNNFDYQAWADGKEFHVGDKLVFNYVEGNHNVHRVDGTGFRLCAPMGPLAAEPLTSGSDVITLTTPGQKWYICGKGSHCESGQQKLAVTVLPQVGSPAVPPSPGAATGSASFSTAWIIAAWGAFLAFMG